MDAASRRQVRLMLWKDYLIRKRKLVTLTGAVWATLVMLSLVIVRKNIDTQNLPTCQYAARALPSAGMLTFLQSFICSINNDCSPLDQYEEIPRYQNSRIRALERQFSPLLYNESILGAAEVAPDALKLVSTLAQAIDNPDIHQIARNGLHLRDLFVEPDRVQRYLTAQLELEPADVRDIMAAEISFQGLFNSTLDKCDAGSLADLIQADPASLERLARRLCNVTDQQLERVTMPLLAEVNYRKYFKMISAVVSGGEWAGGLAAALRLSRAESYAPAELLDLLAADRLPSAYFNLTMLKTFMDLFEPTFGDTDTYKSVRGVTDTLVDGVQWVHGLLQRPMNSNGTSSTVREAVSLVFKGLQSHKAPQSLGDVSRELERLRDSIQDGFDTLSETINSTQISVASVFGVLSKVTASIIKILPKKTQHEVFYYGTLLIKLAEGAHRTADTNLRMEEIMFAASERHPAALRVLAALLPSVVGRMLDALADAERTQIFTSRISHPRQMFCDAGLLQRSLRVSRSEADALQRQLCSDVWVDYAADVIRSFGIFDVKDNINKMAYLVVAETLGRDNSDNLYSIERDFSVVRSLVEDFSGEREERTMDWPRLLNMSADAELFRVVRGKLPLVKKILITVHGALAHEVVKQNPILEAKITPILVHSTTLLAALRAELAAFPRSLVDSFGELYADIAKVALGTLLDREKTYRALSATAQDMVCGGAEGAARYFAFPERVDGQLVSSTLCQLSVQFDRTLDGNSKLAKSIHSILYDRLDPMKDINWVALISQLKELYALLEKDFGYVLAPTTYRMGNATVAEVAARARKVKDYWFSADHLDHSLHLSLKLGFLALDVLDRRLFNLSAAPAWDHVRRGVDAANSFLVLTGQLARLVAAVSAGEGGDIPGLPLTADITRLVVPNLPHLVRDAADVVVADNTSIHELIAVLNTPPRWPCGARGAADALALGVQARDAARGLELAACAGRELREEWARNEHAEKLLSAFSGKPDNTTVLDPHVFLRLSGNLDELVRDLGSLDRALSTETNNSEHLSIVDAVKYAVKIVNENNHNSSLFRKVFAKLDLVLDQIDSPSDDSVPVSMMWEQYLGCGNSSDAAEQCATVGRAAWKYTLRFLSTAAYGVVSDMQKYFSEVNEPNTTLLQIMGFTRGTPLYTLYEKLPDFVGVLLNSYWDQGFMNQVRRASTSQFWDCAALVEALVAPLGSRLSAEDVRRARPYVCPSVLYWISLPRGENTLLDVVATTQYYFYNLQAKDLNSSFAPAFEKTLQFSKLLDDISKTNISQAMLNISVETKFNKMVDGLLSWNISEEDSSYRLFNEINKKQFISTIYLTKVTLIVNKIVDSISSWNTSELSAEASKEVAVFLKLFKRRPAAMMEIYFDAITDVLWKNKDDYKIVDSLNAICKNLETNGTSYIMSDNRLFKMQLCAKNYKLVHDNIEDALEMNAREVLNIFVDGLQKGAALDEIDMFEFFNERKELVKLLKLSMRYSDDLGLAIYAKYLQSSLQHYGVVLSFLAGADWWTELRTLYPGPFATQFFDTVENSFAIVEDVLAHVNKIKLVRLLKDTDVNSTDAFCLDSVALADYVPDATGGLSAVKRALCGADRARLFGELPPLLFASQGYESTLKLPRDVKYTSIEADIAAVQTKLNIVRDGPRAPRRPSWITPEKLEHLREVTRDLFSKTSLTKMVFGAVSNLIDGVTLFMNTSDCAACSPLTAWLRQINLQLIKKDDYEALLCRLAESNLADTYGVLRADFHWDMAVRELVSKRNYTIYELNKALNQFLEHVSAHALHALTSPASRAHDCLAGDIGHNILGNVSVHVTIVAKTLRMVRSSLPHLGEILGVKQSDVLVKLSGQVAHRLSATVALSEVLVNGTELGHLLDKSFGNGSELLKDMEKSLVDISKVQNYKDIEISEWLKLDDGDLHKICSQLNCTILSELISRHVNTTDIKKRLPRLQSEEFWKFGWLAEPMLHAERLLRHAAGVLTVGSRLELARLVDGRLVAILDAALTLLQKDNMDTLLYSLKGIIEELHPLLKNTELGFDLDSLSDGLLGLGRFRDSIVEENDLSVEVWRLVSDPERLEHDMRELGFNHTNFWSVAAPRIHAGSIDFKPLLSSPEREVRVRDYACRPALAARALRPAPAAGATQDDVLAAVADQLCAADDASADRLMTALLRNLNVTYVFSEILDAVLLEVYRASDLTEARGRRVLARYRELAALMPAVRDRLGSAARTLADEPLLAAFRSADSVKGLLSSPEFLASAGDMLCGKSLATDNSRFYRTIAETKDYSTAPDPRQLESLPTDFCRSLYKDVLSMAGGKIVWSFVKPLLMGRVLFTPDTPDVRQLMSAANSTFAQMSRMRDLIGDFGGAFDSLESLARHRESLVTLRELMGSGRFRALRDSFAGDAGDAGDALGDMDLAGMLEELGDVKEMGGMVKKLSDLLGCLNFNRFLPMPDELRLSNEAVKLTMVNEFSAGIVFTGDLQNTNNVEYKIRMDIESVPTTTRKKNQFWTPGPEASFLENMRYFRGFVQIQDLLDRAIVQRAHGRSNRTRRGVDRSQPPDWAVYTQQMPYPCYKRDVFQSSLYESQALIVAFFFSLILTVSSAVRFTVHERESGNTMLMSAMGLHIRNHTTSWLLASLLETLVTTTLMFLALRLGGVLPHSDPSLLWALMFNFGFSVVMFCYMVSKLFSSASLGSVCASILYLVTFLPYVIVLSMEAVLSDAEKVLTCLSMSTAFSYSVLYVARYEATGAGAQWSTAWSSPAPGDSMSIAGTTLMVLADALLYALIGWLIERFTEYKRRTDNLTQSACAGDEEGVSIVRVSKLYGGRHALRGVSAELRRGQVTALLGHNGAGKTTLINIIMGVTKPTSGSIVIRCGDGTDNGSDSGPGVKLGVCPQHDVLLESVTAAEHLQLYARLKSGGARGDVELEVQSMLHALCLGGLAYEPVRRLSGGLRRRLAVALAFVSQPRLVLLDEPSSGVDPVARRDIWSLIMKLKESRTVLMTTHHLDEAELLSDQILIMHKGQVHTSGSPIEIKRSLGSGYKLTAFYTKSYLPTVALPDIKDSDVLNTWNEEAESEPKLTPIEECSKELLTAVRTVVKNAQLADAKGREVEITLPFFDAHGLHTDFLGLCKLLESRQSELQFSSFSMDCSSLEQVFLGICQQADSEAARAGTAEGDYSPDFSTMSSSSSNEYQTKTASPGDISTLVPEGRLQASSWEQYEALLHKRCLHYRRNLWLLALLFALPTLFVLVAMAFSLVRPPADNEVALGLRPELYEGATEFLVSHPSVADGAEGMAGFAEDVLATLARSKRATEWIPNDNPQCKCTDVRQDCEYGDHDGTLPLLLTLPNATTALDWVTTTQHLYTEKRYGGWSSAVALNATSLVAWYNNKGHHALPAYLNALGTAALRAATGDPAANITAYSHPLKISHEQLSKSTLLQHVADVGIAGVILIGFSLVPAGAAIYLVHERVTQQKRLQLLCGVTPATYWLAALTWDMLVIVINIGLTVCVLELFQLPAFVEKDNLPAICLLLLLFGWACGGFTHVCEKLFSDPSLANMLLFCCNVFVGVAGLAVLLILDLISDSDATDNARWTLHKIFLLSPQFALGDGLIEIAKNSIQAQVLGRFGMDTYSSPLRGGLVACHYAALALVGLLMFALNLAIEHDWLNQYVARWWTSTPEAQPDSEMEDMEVATERYRVELAVARARAVARPTHLHTIGNINAGFVSTEGKALKPDKLSSLPAAAAGGGDALQCVSLRKEYAAASGTRVAVHDLTLGIPPGQCLALLGENGAGKSTTFGMLTGELRPSSGCVLLRERPAAGRRLCRGHISYCPQSDAIDPLLSVREQLRFYCRLRAISTETEAYIQRDLSEQVIRKTLELFELEKYAEQRTRTLSGGNKRKLCTAIAFMGRSPLILLDEPTSGMDAGARAVVRRGVAAACGAGRAVLLSTHALDDARRLAHRLALLHRGRLRTVAHVHQSLTRWGGGHVVTARVARGADAGVAWRAVRERLPRATLLAQHQATLQFLLPAADGSSEEGRLSYLFGELAALQGRYDVEDFTVNQSSLYQMFARFSDKELAAHAAPPAAALAPTPAADSRRDCAGANLTSVTAL